MHVALKMLQTGLYNERYRINLGLALFHINIIIYFCMLVIKPVSALCPLPSAGPVVLSSPAQLVAPVLVARGTLSITTTEIYFEVDEDDPAFKRVDSKVSKLQASV